ncbi:hypothetical protein V1509DRAFT_489309 [Lipomyces kononenkoae]
MPSTPGLPRIVRTDERTRSLASRESSDDISDNVSDDDNSNEDHSERVTWLTSDTPRPRKVTGPATVQSARRLANDSAQSHKFTAFRPQGRGGDVTNLSGSPIRIPLRPFSRSDLNTRRSGTEVLSESAPLKTVDNTHELMIHSDDIEEDSDLALDVDYRDKSEIDSETSEVDEGRLNVTQQNISSTPAAPKWRPNHPKTDSVSEQYSDGIDNISSEQDTVPSRPSKVRIIDDIESQVPSLPTAGCDPIEDTSQVLDTQLRDSPAVIRYSRAGVIDLDLIPSSASRSVTASQAKEEVDGKPEDILPEKPLKTPNSFWPLFVPMTPSSSGRKTKALVTGSQIAQRIQLQPYYDIASTPPLSASKSGYCQTPTVSKTIQPSRSQSMYTTGIAGLVASWVVKVHSDVQLNALVGNVSPLVGLSKRRPDILDIDKAAGLKMTRTLRTYEFWKVLLHNKGYSYGSKNYAGFTLVHLQRCGRQQDYSSDDDFGIDSPGHGEIAWAILFDATSASSLVPTSTGPNDVSLTTVMLSDTRLTKGTILRLYKPVWRVQLTDQDMDAFFKAGYDSYSDQGVLLVCINWQIVE